MKKALSILLSVMMVAGLFIAMIPTASAAYTIPTPIPEVTKGELIYSEDFENTDYAGLVDDELLAAMGWTNNYDKLALAIVNDEDVTTRLSEEIYGKLSDWQKTGNARLQMSEGEGKAGPTMVVDDRLAGGDYIFEYTAIMLDNVKQDDGQGLGFSSTGWGNSVSGNNNWLYTIWKTNFKERGDFDMHTCYQSASNTALISTGDFDPSEKINAANSANGADYAYKTDRNRGSIAHRELKVRITVDADFGWYLSVYNADTDAWDVWCSPKADAALIQQWQSKAPYIGNSILIRLLGGPTMLLDDVNIWTIDKTNYTPSELAGAKFVYPNADNSEMSDDALVITSVNTDAMPETTAYDVITGHPNPANWESMGEILLDENGAYKYAPDGTNDRLRFEYVEVYNASSVTKNIYDYAITINNGVQKNYLTDTVGANEITPIRAGKNTSYSANNTWGYTYVNPDYADGAIAPGESAILMIPNNWWNAACTVGTNESFREIYLKGILGYSNEQAAATKVYTIAPEANGLGIDNSGTALIGMVPLVDGAIPEGYVGGPSLDQTYLESYVISNKTAAATHGFNSNAAKENTINLVQGYNPPANFTANYDHWTDEGEYIPAGILSANSNTLETTTPGTIPEELQRVYARDKAEWTGWQAAEDGDVRLIAEIADITDVFAIGFEIYLPGMMEDEETGEPFTKTVYVEYVYNKLTTNFGTEDLGFKYADSNYFVALEIVGAAVNEFPTEFEVKMVTAYDDGKVITTKPVTFTAEYIVEA